MMAKRYVNERVKQSSHFNDNAILKIIMEMRNVNIIEINGVSIVSKNR